MILYMGIDIEDFSVYRIGCCYYPERRTLCNAFLKLDYNIDCFRYHMKKTKVNSFYSAKKKIIIT